MQKTSADNPIGVSRKRSSTMPAPNPNRAPTRGPPPIPATTANNSMMSGPAPNTRRRSRTVSSTTRKSNTTNGTLARALFIWPCSRGIALRLPDEHLHEVETDEIDEGVDGHFLLQRPRRHLGGAPLAHGNVRREPASLQTAGDNPLPACHFGADVDEVDG